MVSWPRLRQSVQVRKLPRPHNQYLAESDGTVYALFLKVRFFNPDRYGATCVDVQLDR